METFETHTGHNFLTKDKVTAATAHAVMDEAGALFDVTFPASGYEDFAGGIRIPTVKGGVRSGTP